MSITSPCLGLQLAFDGATRNEQALVHAAVDLSLFDFERLPTTVTLDFNSAPPSDLHNAFAYTTIAAGALDTCSLPTAARVYVIPDLDDPGRAGDEGGAARGTYAGDHFFLETIEHELAHVVAGRFSSSDIAAICDCFGRPADEWSQPYSELPWERQVREAFAETFKDIYLPRNLRKFNNRTKVRLRRSKLEQLYAVLDGICCCPDEISST